MKKGIKLIAIALLASSVIITACKKKDEAVYVDDVDITMDENPANGESIENLDATSEIGTLGYALTSEFPAGAIKLDSVSGTLTVRDAYLFNFEINPSITATIEVTNGTNTEVVDVTVTLSDVDEVPAVIGDYRDGGIEYVLNNPRYKNQLYLYRIKFINLTLRLKQFVDAGVGL
ncbi:MAG: cadherin repeat domain-containing protein [Flavobacteriales bacterium]|nr:cadherin repeat domain-containing protein [Flavobacteriales bacterium]